jgi:hypothetical protein
MKSEHYPADAAVQQKSATATSSVVSAGFPILDHAISCKPSFAETSLPNQPVIPPMTVECSFRSDRGQLNQLNGTAGPSLVVRVCRVQGNQPGPHLLSFLRS